MKKSEFTVLYKNVATLGSPEAKNADPKVYEFKVLARDSREAVKLLHESRMFTVKTASGKIRKGFHHFTVVRVTSGDPTMFKTFRGKFEKKFILVIPSKMPKEMR